MTDNVSNIKTLNFGTRKPEVVVTPTAHDATVVQILPANIFPLKATKWVSDESLLPPAFRGYQKNRIGKPDTTRAHMYIDNDHLVENRPSMEGDWIVLDHMGCFGVYSDRLFKQRYRIDGVTND